MYPIVRTFDEKAFEQGVHACEEHCRLVDHGHRNERSLPACPFPLGSDAAGSWRAGFYFGLPFPT